MSNTDIRAMHAGDLDAVRDLHLRNWRDSYAGLIDPGFLGEPVVRDMARRWAQVPPAPDLALVAIKGGVLTGFARLRVNHAEGPLLMNLHVDAHHRGTGSGRALFEACVRHVAEQRLDQLWLEVLSGNEAARTLYARWGGVESAPFQDSISGTPVTSVRISWPSLSGLVPARGKPS
ncbi:MAG: GNAT family N-acetyltransferase [Pseudomonadota bacterium]